jgi:hypothetical protein
LDKKFIIIPSALIAVIKEKKVSGDLGKQEKQNFSELEQKIFLAMMYFAFEQKYQNPSQIQYDLHFGELRKLFKSLMGRSNDEFLQAIKELSITTVLVTDTLHKENKPVDKINDPFYEPFVMLTSSDSYDNGVLFTFPPQIDSRLLKPKPFVKLPIFELNAIAGSKYTLPLYALIKDYENSPRRQTPKIGLEALWGILGVAIENSDFAKLRDKVINRALKSINTRTNIDVKMSVQRRDKQAASIHFTVNKKIKSEVVDENDPLDGFTGSVKYAIRCLAKNKDYNYQIKLAEKYRNGDIRTIKNIEAKLIKESGSSEEIIANDVWIIKNYLRKLPVFFESKSIGVPDFIRLEKEKAEYYLVDLDRSKIPVTLNNVRDIAKEIRSLKQAYYDEATLLVVNFVNEQFQNPKYKFSYFVIENEIKKYLQPNHISIVKGELQCTYLEVGSNETIVKSLQNGQLQGFIKNISDQYSVSTD